MGLVMRFVAAVLMAVWRREFGRTVWLRRTVLVGLSALVGVPAWFTLPWWSAAVVTLLAVGHWPDGHRFDKPWYLLGRYSYVPIAMCLWLAVISPLFGAPDLGLRPYTLLAVGPVSALGYTIARITRVPYVSSYLDGYSSVGELVLGAGFGYALMYAVGY